METSQPQNVPPSTIAATVRIGVTGHRRLPDEALVRAALRTALADYDRILAHTPHTFVVISPLAEGADRLVAQAVLDWPVAEGVSKPSLEVVLPMPVDEYCRDFKSLASQKEFNDLLEQAAQTYPPLPRPSHTAAYDQAGHSVVQRCDLLVAVWDGKPSKGEGGTADIVEYARGFERTILWIHSETGRLTQENGKDHSLESFEHLDAYNRERLRELDVRQAVEAHHHLLAEAAKNSGLDPAYLDCGYRDLLPHFVRADLLAARYQTLHSRAGSAVYVLATAAVAVVAIQKIFFPELPSLVFLEVFAMVPILLLIYFSGKKDWHRRWIDYRLLAERLRAALFLSLAGADCKAETVSPHSNSQVSREWMFRAFETIWEDCGHDRPGAEPPLDPLKDFILTTWIRTQMDWFKKKGKQHHSRHAQLAQVGAGIFGLTLVGATLHALGLGESMNILSVPLPDLLTFLAIVLPSAGAALAGYRVHREYERNAERYVHMVPLLSLITEQIEAARDSHSLAHWLEEASDVLLTENQDWHLAFLFRKLELP